jgi:RNA polymerase sigma factor (sigma-70 family)
MSASAYYDGSLQVAVPEPQRDRQRPLDARPGAGDWSRVTEAHPTRARSWTVLYERLRLNPNDAVAFAALAGRVRGWTRTSLAEPGAARYGDDIVADTCSAVILGIEDAYGAETFPSFVYGHYRNARRRLLQDSRFAVPLGDLDPPDSSVSQPAPDELSLLERCLSALPPRERRAVELRYLGHASTREIADALGVSVVNARQIVFSGLTRLRRDARRAWPMGRS